jgi:hypothetical protein
VHVGFVDDGAPIVLPMIGKMGQFEDNPMAMYIHGMTAPGLRISGGGSRLGSLIGLC